MAVTAVVVRSVLRCRRYTNQRVTGHGRHAGDFYRRDRCRKLAYLIAGGRASVEAQFDRAISEALLPENG
jgi:hypothetical protein